MEVVLQQDIGFEQDKKVFCIPRNIGETKGAGTNELIKKGGILVTSPYDILKELGTETKKVNKNMNMKLTGSQRT